MRKSIIQSKYVCKKCGCHAQCSHEVFYGTANRPKSIEDKMVIYLCNYHHNTSNQGIHFDKKFDEKEKQEAQTIWESSYGDREAFIKRFGRNYL